MKTLLKFAPFLLLPIFASDVAHACTVAVSAVSFPSSPNAVVPSNAPFVGGQISFNPTEVFILGVQDSAGNKLGVPVVEGKVAVRDLPEGNYALMVDTTKYYTANKQSLVPFQVGPAAPRTFSKGKAVVTKFEFVKGSGGGGACGPSEDSLLARIEYEADASFVPFAPIAHLRIGSNTGYVLPFVGSKVTTTSYITCAKADRKVKLALTPELFGEGAASDIPSTDLEIEFPSCDTVKNGGGSAVPTTEPNPPIDVLPPGATPSDGEDDDASGGGCSTSRTSSNGLGAMSLAIGAVLLGVRRRRKQGDD